MDLDTHPGFESAIFSILFPCVFELEYTEGVLQLQKYFQKMKNILI